MTQFFILFWSVIVFSSIAWYAVLLLYVGSKGAKEIREMTRRLRERGKLED